MAVDAEDLAEEQLEEEPDNHTYMAGSTGKTADIAVEQDAAAAAAAALRVAPPAAVVGAADTKTLVVDTKVAVVSVALLVDAVVAVLVVASLALVEIAQQQQQQQEDSYHVGVDSSGTEAADDNIAGAKVPGSRKHAAHQAKENGAAASRRPQKTPQVRGRGPGGARRCHCCWKTSTTVQ